MRIFSTDHKVIGLQYACTSFAFLAAGFLLVLIARWHLAWPTDPVPFAGPLLGDANASSGVLRPEFYNQIGAMHGTIMVFLAVVPLAVGAFGNYLVPLMIGASDMAFPRLNRASYWLYLAAGLVMIAGFLLPGGAASSGWTSYPPLAVLATTGQTAWLAGLILLSLSSLVASINTIVTIFQLRAPGLTMMRLPFFVWTQLVTAFLLLLAFPPLQAAAILQLMDRVTGTSFFLPSGLVISGVPLAVSGGGSPLLWQHLFWFLAHPEVYVLILPALGIVAEVIANISRRPLWGYRALVGAAAFMAFMSFLVWAHHMFLTGMGPAMSAFFQVTTMIISVPSVVIVSALLLSLYGGSIRFTVPGLFALAFLPMFGIGGLTGLPLGLAAADIPLHDTNYVVGHFHYVVAPGTLFALFAGVYYWFPKVTGRRLHDGLGRVHFWGSLVAMNGVFLPMLVQGLAGVNRRMFDGGRSYASFTGLEPTFVLQAWAAALLGVVQITFVANVAWSLARGRRAAANPWEATTLEWATSSPPPHDNFPEAPVVCRGPYDYSLPGASADFSLQNER
jgi:cytochrome c oxidase subunit 1